uniref:Uncharacterized protein n=1 Tax=Anopheles minimus TaxID=112268 RepID=A0A182WJD7_9DIPT
MVVVHIFTSDPTRQSESAGVPVFIETESRLVIRKESVEYTPRYILLITSPNSTKTVTDSLKFSTFGLIRHPEPS